MAVTAKKASDISVAPKKWIVRLGNASGDTPSPTNETKLLRYPVVHLGAGGQQMDRIQLTYDLSTNRERIVDQSIKQGLARQVEVVEIPREPQGKHKLIAWGELTSEGKEVGDGETLTYTATIEPYHFGSTLNGVLVRRPSGSHDAVTINGEITFNPTKDGHVEGNRSGYLASGGHDAYYWVDPESVRTTAARAYVGDSGNDWELLDVINSLCWHCNPNETYITNPSYQDLTKWLTDPPPVRNIRLPPGKYLSEYLDLILEPLGYSWRFTYAYDVEVGPSSTTYTRRVSFQIFRLGEGLPIAVLQQRPSLTTSASHSKSNTSKWSVETDIGELVNEVRVEGAKIQREVTIELYRGWPEADDTKTATELTQSEKADYELHQNAWRLWIANEAGDYCELRTTTKPIPATPLDLSTVLTSDYIPKRRPALDCLTHHQDDTSSEARRRRAPLIEWYNTDDEWAPLPNGWGETVLTDQLGVYFAGDSPPSELIDRGDDARIRITCTIEGDKKISATATRSSESINLRTRKITVDAQDRFVDYQIQSGGTYASILAGIPSSDARQDTTEISDLAEKIRQQEDMAAIRGEFEIVGLSSIYSVGKLVSAVAGRNVDFNRRADTATEQKFSQIMTVIYDYQSQSTRLIVQPINEPRES